MPLHFLIIGNKTGTFLKDKKDKSFVVNYLSFYLVPRPAFEIIKVGKIWVKRKTQKNAAI